jgi:hypothetical protein
MYYIHLYICMYMYLHVHVGMYLYEQGTDMSVHGTDMSVPFCQILSRWPGFQMWNFFRGSPGCNPAPPPGAAALHTEKCSMLCHCVATTAAARAQQAADSVICARHEFVILLILELVHMQGWSS